MTLVEIADMLAAALELENVYAGNIDGDQKRCIGVYDAKVGDARTICLGGKDCTKTLYKKVVILIHWTDQPSFAEDKATEIFNVLSDVRNYKSEDHTIRFISPDMPAFAGRDERGVCEYVIQAKIYYERNDKHE